MKLRLSVMFIFGMIASISTRAQITVDNTLTIEELVNDVLLGDGVVTSNITYNGLPGDQVSVQVGTFSVNDPDSPFSIQTGVLMSTSYLEIVNEGGGNTNATEPGFPDYFDQDLADIAGFDSRNSAVIEFDFVVASDSVKFNYVFSSAEYPSFTCSDFNDVFGFFLSGPGINGPFLNNAINIALIPNSEFAVGVNSVNSGSPANDEDCLSVNPNYEEDSQYFVANDPPAPNSIQIPGHTVTFTALSDIECGGTYHIKLAIANASDQALQSAVFLEAGSFAAFGDVFVNLAPTIGGAVVVEPQYADVLVAGCGEVLIELTRPEGLTVDSIFVEFGGTAIIDEDYVIGENDTLFFFADGVDTLFFSIETLYDGIPNENEVLEILVFYQNGCGEFDTAFASIPIVDPYFLESATEDVELFCPIDSIPITAVGSNGIAPYMYDWGEEGLGQTVIVDVPLDQQYFVVGITDQCGFEIVLDSVLVTNSIPPPLSIGIDPFVQPVCSNQPIDLSSTVINGNGPPYFYAWSDNANNNYPGLDNIRVQDINPVVDFHRGALEVYLTVVDTCGTTFRDTVTINYPFYEPLTASFPPLFDNCPDEPVVLEGQTAGGAGELIYLWAIDNQDASFAPGSISSDTTARVNVGGGSNVFTLYVTDRCRRQNWDSFVITGGGSELDFAGDALYEDSLNVILLNRIMNVMTPDGDNRNEFFVLAGIDKFDDARFEVYDRWGKLIFETDDYDAASPEFKPVNAFDAADIEDGTYFYIINVDKGECTASGTIEVLRGND